MSRMHVMRLAILAVAAILMAGGPLGATTVVRMDAAELSDQAELVFTGTAVEKKVVLSKDGTYPYTFVTFAVEDVLKGGTLWKEITLRFDGGRVGDLTLNVEGMPSFEKGESYLLFVRDNGSVSCPVLGWWQGQYRYATDAASKKRILVDSAGVPVEGVEHGRFRRAVPEEVSRGAAVVSVEGVQVGTPRGLDSVKDATLRPAETPDADRVVAELRSLIARRGAGRNVRPGRMVESARPEDVPQRDGSRAAAPAR